MPQIFIFYHFLHPDDVVSAVHFSELATGLAERGWEVTAFPCNRGHHENSTETYPRREGWKGIQFERIWRPKWSQSGHVARIFNAVWMLGRWSLLGVNPKRRPAALIIGSDPVLSILVAPIWRWLKPKTLIAHWCFDLYPEAAYAEGLLREHGKLSFMLRGILRLAYRGCDLIVDIGPKMRQRLLAYGTHSARSTIIPWALKEPAAVVPTTAPDRAAIFGSATLGLMYSGTFGRAHSFEDMLALVRLLRPDGASLALSVRGHREDELRAAIHAGEDNIHFLPFASTEELEQRLAAADVHVVTLRSEWAGTVVPSKFFGALAIGRPVLFCGSPESDIAQWIQAHGIGWVLAPGDAPAVAQQMRAAMQDPAAITAMRERCFRLYQDQFSRRHGLQLWDAELRGLLRRG